MTGTKVPTIEAVDHVRRMRGGSQSHLLRCSDGHHYVVKFQNNPQGKRILVNELLGTLLAQQLGLPVQETAIVHVNERIVEWSKGLLFHLPQGSVPCRAGLCYGSRYPAGERSSVPSVHDMVPESHLRDVENRSDFLGMLVFDKWVCNTDQRQVIFLRQGQNRAFQVRMIDQGNCFNADKWTFPDAPLYGIYRNTVVYQGVGGMEAFNVWLEALRRRIDADVLRTIANEIPHEWYDGDEKSLDHIVQQLDRRRLLVEQLLWLTRSAAPSAFPMWSYAAARCSGSLQ